MQVVIFIKHMKLAQIYLSYKGRLSLKDYWIYWALPLIIIELLLMYYEEDGPEYKWLWSITNTLIIWPAIATTIKRLHDINKSGWWTLAHLMPFIGSVILQLVLSIIPGTKGKNQYG